jgi:hypothetical protein
MLTIPLFSYGLSFFVFLDGISSVLFFHFIPCNIFFSSQTPLLCWHPFSIITITDILVVVSLFSLDFLVLKSKKKNYNAPVPHRTVITPLTFFFCFCFYIVFSGVSLSVYVICVYMLSGSLTTIIFEYSPSSLPSHQISSICICASHSVL